MSAIFISYRRKYTLGTAKEIHRELYRHYGEDAVFFDERSIQIGKDLRSCIRDELTLCEVFLALIDEGWIASLRDLDLEDFVMEGSWQDPNDWIVLEVMEALKTDGLSIVPVLINVDMPRPADLHPKIRGIRSWRGFPFRSDLFHQDMPFLIEKIDEILKGSLLTLPPKSSKRRDLYRHEAKYCIQNNAGKSIPEISHLYLNTLANHCNLSEADSEQAYRLISSAQKPYKTYINFVRKVMQEGYLDEGGTYRLSELCLSKEAKKYLRRLDQILELPRWQTLKIEDEEIRNLSQYLTTMTVLHYTLLSGTHCLKKYTLYIIKNHDEYTVNQMS